MAYVITDKCVACGTCLPVCPVEAISEGDIYHIDASNVVLALKYAPAKLSFRAKLSHLTLLHIKTGPNQGRF